MDLWTIFLWIILDRKWTFELNLALELSLVNYDQNND